MSVISMTGFGRGQASGHGVQVVVELSSVNRKQFDCHVNLPREWAGLEAQVQTQVHAVIQRGHVKGAIEIRRGKSGQQAVQLDLALARARLTALRQAARKLGLQDDLTARCLLDWPDVLRVETPALDPAAVWPLVERAVADALTKLLVMRQREGQSLARDLKMRLGRLRRLVAQIQQRAPAVARGYRRALAERIAAANQGCQLDAATLARELALFADRCDIQEELTRLASHFNQAGTMLAGGASCGRTMDFLCQEFFREINTIGAKANDAAMAKLVVVGKAELEAIREQVQNVE
jgi:uncharacterized protein (TIGR00255 family)